MERRLWDGNEVARVLGMKGLASHERNVARHLEAFGASVNVQIGKSRLQVVDPEIERRDGNRLAELEENGDAARGVHQRGDRSTVKHARRRVADELFVVRKGQRNARSFRFHETDSERAVVWDVRDDPLADTRVQRIAF
jgi:hypothetical protein